MKIVARVSKKVYLEELIGKYNEETAAAKAEPKKKRAREVCVRYRLRIGLLISCSLKR